jgi:GH15 family glucan-1,4-alpha-glucosidase
MTKVILLIVSSLAASCLQAQKTSLPIMEGLFGPSSTNASAGNGRLTVGISKYGELVNLRWPCSNFYDHLNYKTLFPVPPFRKVEQYDRYLNASRKLGSYPAIQYSQGGKKMISELRTEDWQVRQSYYSDNAPIIVTVFENKLLGLKITNTDFVATDLDVFIRHYSAEKTGDSGLSDIKLVYLANMAPCNYKTEFDPSSDWVNDYNNGFANIYDKVNDYFISFNPNKPAKANQKLPVSDTSAKLVGQYIAELDQLYPAQVGRNNIDVSDIYCIVGGSLKASATAMYNDKSANTPMPDLSVANHLKFTTGAAILVSSYDLSITGQGKAEVDILFSFANNAKEAATLMTTARHRGYDNLLAASVSYWNKKLATAQLPAVPTNRMTKTLKRTLVNLLISTNGDGGGIGSSVSATQPPYSMLWIRDAAMMGMVLDLAGYHEEAEKNSLFYINTQRKRNHEICREPLKFECYKGSWFQCYYADGKPSWIYDFEIDEVGWGIWLFYSHSRFLKGEARQTYLEKVFPSVELAADFLVTFKDPFSKLQKRAREDDVLWQDQSIYGAASVLLGLKAAVSTAKAMNHREKQIQWQQRADELEKAIDKWLWNKKTSEYQQPIYGNFGPRGIIVWPALVSNSSNTKVQLHGAALARQVDPFFTRATESKNKEWWYIGKTTTAIAFASQNDSAKAALARHYLQMLLEEVCTPDTHVFGETPMVRDIQQSIEGKKEIKTIYDNRVGQPCNIAAVWIYMTAEMLYGAHKELLNNLYE